MAFHVLVTGYGWHDMPRRLGAYQIAWRRLNRWLKDGVWNRIFALVQKRAYSMGKFNLETMSVDSTLIDSKKVASPQDTMDVSGEKE